MLAYALGVATVALLIAWQAQEAQAGAIMVGGVGGLLLVSALAAWGLIALLKKLPRKGISWRFGLANLSRRRFASSLQVGALALGMMALLLLTLVRGDLMNAWRANLPPDAPNQFLVNVLPDQVDDARATLSQRFGREIAFSPDGARPAGRGERAAARHHEVRRCARTAARRARVQPVVDGRAPGRATASSQGRFWAKDAKGVDEGMSLEDGIASRWA